MIHKNPNEFKDNCKMVDPFISLHFLFSTYLFFENFILKMKGLLHGRQLIYLIYLKAKQAFNMKIEIQ